MHYEYVDLNKIFIMYYCKKLLFIGNAKCKPKKINSITVKN